MVLSMTNTPPRFFWGGLARPAAGLRIFNLRAPQPTMTRVVPREMARKMSWPVPTVEAITGSLPSSPPAIQSPEACAISMTVVVPTCRAVEGTELPFRRHRRAERPGHLVVATLPGEGRQQPVAPVSEGHLRGRPTGAPRAGAELHPLPGPRQRCRGNLSGAATRWPAGREIPRI